MKKKKHKDRFPCFSISQKFGPDTHAWWLCPSEKTWPICKVGEVSVLFFWVEVGEVS